MKLVEVSIKSHIPFRLICSAFGVVIVVFGSKDLCKVSQSMKTPVLATSDYFGQVKKIFKMVICDFSLFYNFWISNIDYIYFCLQVIYKLVL